MSHADHRHECHERAPLRVAAKLCAVNAVWLVLIALPAALRAEDRVVLQPGGRFSSRITVKGRIEDYTGDHLRIQLKTGGAAKSYPAEQVIEVDTPQSPSHQRGLSLLAVDDVERAIPEFQAALGEEDRVWVRREILAQLVRCALRLADYSSAGSRFLAIVQSDPKTRHFRLIPLAWGAMPLEGGLRSEVEGWLNSESEVAQLLGASFLLEDSRRHGPALAMLKQLATSADRRVQVLAQTQLLRQRLSAGDVSRVEIENWQNRIDLIPNDLRGGAYFLLGKAQLRLREYELGAAALLRLPLVYNDDVQLAARAELMAADALSRIGQTEAAAGLYREITTRFAGTTFAIDARGRLSERDTKPDSSDAK